MYIVFILHLHYVVHEIILLSKGLKFVPYKNISLNNHCESLDKFSTTLKSYAAPFQYDIPKHPLLPYKSWSNCSDHSAWIIKQFIDANKQDLMNATTVPVKQSNLNHKEMEVLHTLAKRRDIIIKSSDKGDKIVVETIENYIKDELAHLENQDIYQHIKSDINPELAKTINKFVDQAYQKGCIDKDTNDFLTQVIEPRTPLIYFLKKLHKNSISVRPIVSNINSPISQL